MSDTAGPGHNTPDYAKEEFGRLEREYSNLDASILALEAEADTLPDSVTDQEIADMFTAAITRFKDMDDQLEGFRNSEKLPYLRKGDTVDSFFFSRRERLLRRKKGDKPGRGDMLHAKLHAYNVKRLEEEKRQREAAEAAAREAERKLREQREAAEREQREAQERADRARKAENIEAAEKAAREAQSRADELAAQEQAAIAERYAAQDAAAAKPADMVRERHSGAMNTMKMVWHVEVTDSMKLDVAALWPFVTDEAKEKAAKAWAKMTGHKKTMDGLLIEQRPDTMVRR